MIFDINRRALISKDPGDYNDSVPSHRPSRSLATEEVYERLIKDTNRRTHGRQRLEAYNQAREELMTEGNSRLIPKTDSEAVFSRLSLDVSRRQDIKQATEMYKAKEAEEEVVSFTLAEKSMSKETTRLMVERLNGKAETGEAEARQNKRQANRLEAEQKEKDEIERLANLHHPRRSPDPKVQERLVQDHRSARGSRHLRWASDPDYKPEKLFTVREAVKSGERLTKATTYHARGRENPGRSKQLMGDSRLFKGKGLSSKSLREPQQSSLTSAYSPTRQLQMSEASFKVDPSHYPSSDTSSILSPSLTASLKSSPIRLRTRLRRIMTNLTSKSFITEAQKTGRYNYSRAIAEMKQSAEALTNPSQRQTERTDSLSFAHLSPIHKSSGAKDGFDAMSRTYYLQGRNCVDKLGDSSARSPIQTASPTKEIPRSLQAVREALNISRVSRPEVSVVSEAPVLSFAAESKQTSGSVLKNVETRPESLHNQEGRASPRRCARHNPEIYQAPDRSTKALQLTPKPTQPSSKHQQPNSAARLEVKRLKGQLKSKDLRPR
jgi:hypothetical protein